MYQTSLKLNMSIMLSNNKKSIRTMIKPLSTICNPPQPQAKPMTNKLLTITIHITRPQLEVFSAMLSNKKKNTSHKRLKAIHMMARYSKSNSRCQWVLEPNEPI